MPASGAVLVGHLPELLLAAIATVLILLEMWAFDPGGPMVGRTVAGVVAGFSLTLIRRRPLAAYLLNGVAVYTLIAIGSPSDFYQWTNLVALFAVASRLPTRIALPSLVLGWVGVVGYFLRFPDEGDLVLAGAVVAIWTAGWFAGRAQYARVAEVEARRDHEITRAELAAEQARSDLEIERTRIARDLHDIIGHAVNVMVIHAGAGQGMTTADPGARAAFDTIATAGRTALADLDRMLGLLEGEPERSPLPGLAQLADLCATVDGENLAVSLTVEGDAASVSPSVGVTAYRVVQEALTNVIKHARASRVSVTVVVDDEVTLTVTDDGRGGRPEPGRGLGGIQARAGLHGGAVRYGPGPGGGFELWCRLPRGIPG